MSTPEERLAKHSDHSRPEERLGRLSDHFESGGGGTETLGWDSAGGLSCGNYQIAVKTGTMAEFLGMCALSPNWTSIAKTLKPLLPGVNKLGRTAALNSPFAKAWVKLASGELLPAAEYVYILSTHYQALFYALPTACREAVAAYDTLQEVVWSIAVQHSRPSGVKIIAGTWKAGIEPADWIIAIYARRHAFKGKNTPQVKESLRKRWIAERNLARLMLALELKQPPTPTPSEARAHSAGGATP